MDKKFMNKRYVFDLDGTLLEGDWSLTDQYFIDTFGDKKLVFLDNMVPLFRCL